MLRSLSIRVYQNEERPRYHFYTAGVEELYFIFLQKVDLGTINHINIYFTSLKKELRKITTNFLDAEVYFNFFEFEELDSNFQKRKYILDTLRNVLVSLCNEHGWNSDPFFDAYKKCLENDIIRSWYFKNKLFASPDKKHHFGLWHIVDFGIYEIYEVLFDSNKKEIARRICFFDNASVFRISYLSWEGNNDKVSYKFNNVSKKFIAVVTDLIEEKKILIPEKTSLFFKS